MVKVCRIFICISVFVVVLSVSVFASSVFSDQPIPYYASTPSNSQLRSNGFVFAVNGSTNHFILTNGNNCVYMFYCPRTDNNSGYSVVCVSVDGNVYNTWRNSTNSGLTTTGTNVYYSDYGWYYSNSFYSLDFATEWNIPYYDSLEAGMTGLGTYLGVIGPSYSSYLDIPSGYVAVVYAKNPSSSSPAGLRSNFSWSSAPNAPYWGNTGQSYKFFDSRPVFTDQTLFPLNGMSAIGWYKGRSTGFNGNTTYAVGEISFSSTLHWCVIYNPWVTFDSSATDPKYNSTIRLHANIAEAYLYPCSQLIGADGWESRSLDDWSNPYVGNAPVDEGGDWYWTEPSEIPGDPPVVVDPGAGGTNEVPPEVTNQNFLQRIIAILDNLLAEISGLFTFAFRAIAALIDAAASFFAVIGGLFTWLPADVVTVIVSGFFLVVTIGVLKSFL